MATKSIQWTGQNRGDIEVFLEPYDVTCFYIGDKLCLSLVGEDSEIELLPSDWLCVNKYSTWFKLTETEYNDEYR